MIALENGNQGYQLILAYEIFGKGHYYCREVFRSMGILLVNVNKVFLRVVPNMIKLFSGTKSKRILKN